jgi:16S rRNA (cytosine967-C5)-methyltransferase
LPARQAAVSIVADVLSGTRTLDAAFDGEHGHEALTSLDRRDRGLVKALATETLRRHGQIRDALDRFITKRPPRNAGAIDAILSVSACQILFLDTPAHAAVDLAVRLAAGDKGARHYKGLVNAVLRRLAEGADDILAGQDAGRLNTPEWLARRWTAHYGIEAAAAIQIAHLAPPPLDLTVKSDPGIWAERLGGTVLPTGTVRLSETGDVTQLAGYGEGAWWVQDAAAALPARLMGDVAELQVADLCAAPGGKTAQLAAAGARVTAIDRSASRLARLRGNLGRLALAAEIVEADAATWRPNEMFDAVLLDAPCSATGTLRRHPDIGWVKREGDIRSIVDLQSRLVDNALAMLKPGGLLVYAVCSLEPEEAEWQARRVIASGRAERVQIEAQEVGGLAQCVTENGDLRTLPFHSPGAQGGMDGFFATRLRAM